MLRQGFSPSTELVAELQQHVRKRLSLHAYPREIEFLAEAPKPRVEKCNAFFCASVADAICCREPMMICDPARCQGHNRCAALLASELTTAAARVP